MLSPVDRHLRRRRSGAGVPALIPPADVPDDAEGRVAFISVGAVEETAVADAGEAPDAVPAEGSPSLLDAWAGSWAAVGVLAAVLLAVFVIGILLTR